MKTRSVFLLLFLVTPSFAQTAGNVLLVINEADPVSVDVGTYYAQKRGIQQSDILPLKTSADDSISREEFERQIESPIRTWLMRNFAQDRILYIVLTKGIPIRIAGSSGQRGTIASVDSELTLLYRKMTGQSEPLAGQVINPYFLGEAPLDRAKQFDREDYDLYLVSRLDGYNGADIRRLIDNGFAPLKEGRIVLDASGSGTGKGDAWLQEASDRLRRLGFKDRVVFDNSKNVQTGLKQVLGYYSWGTNDPEFRTGNFNFEFVPGALAGTFAGSDGRTFRQSPANAHPDEASPPQFLAADLIHSGITGIAAYVSDPYLEGTIRPDILFPAYLSGFNLVESYYLAMPYLSWQTVVVGDPLCAPFRASSLKLEQIDRGIDSETELPSYFGTRRLRTISVAGYRQSGVHPDTIKLILRSEARFAKQDEAGARRALEESLARDDRLPATNFTLASLYESAREYDKAIERYRRLLELLPDNPIVLNNLAFNLAVRKNAVAEALPMAEKAYGMAKQDPRIADTLGWVCHLAGQDDRAIRLLEDAVRSAPGNAEIHLRFAIVSEATGNRLAAQIGLQRALEIDPALEERGEVRQLREKLK